MMVSNTHFQRIFLIMCPVDLTIATAKSLVRLRRDDLVRLCESRDLDVEGTKPQLAEALLQWRDRQSEASSPSSAGTVRPPSTTRQGRRRGSSKGKSITPPVLLRTHVHIDEPRTPPLSSAQRERDEDLELDLESLGLEDREIPPDKLTKLEKIGTGGFKDVFIGKFKGRKVAIAEFRGHLTASKLSFFKTRAADLALIIYTQSGHQGTETFRGVQPPQHRPFRACSLLPRSWQDV
jgi:mitogen-activated protein kinase kinase kinase 13